MIAFVYRQLLSRRSRRALNRAASDACAVATSMTFDVGRLRVGPSDRSGRRKVSEKRTTTSPTLLQCFSYRHPQSPHRAAATHPQRLEIARMEVECRPAQLRIKPRSQQQLAPPERPRAPRRRTARCWALTRDELFRAPRGVSYRKPCRPGPTPQPGEPQRMSSASKAPDRPPTAVWCAKSISGGRLPHLAHLDLSDSFFRIEFRA